VTVIDCGNLPTRVLLVEDEELVRRVIALGLVSKELEVEEAGDGSACLAKLASARFDVVVLDLGLPDVDGVQLAAQLRRCFSGLGIIIVTRRGEVETRIKALDVGADDYLVKPVNPAELSARVRSLVRRRKVPAHRQIRVGQWLVDLDARTVIANGLEAGLTRGEFDILARLVEAEGRVVIRDHLLDTISRNPNEADRRSVDMLVSRLRRKLGGPAATGMELIATSPGHGYRLGVAVETSS
jgi:DNA-binding response OmpR family regulator